MNDFDFDIQKLLSEYKPTPEQIAKAEEEEKRRVEENARHHRAAALRCSRIPARYQWALEHADAYATLGCNASTASRLEEMAPDRFAAFKGPTGAGKTTLACRALWGMKLRHPKIGIMFVTATELEHERRVTRLGTGTADLEGQARESDIVLIDEIGQEVGAFSPLIDIVFARYDWMRPTWVTTGVSAGVLGEKYGAGFVRRIFEGAEVFTLSGSKK